MADPRAPFRQRGFTLIEMLVALAVFSLAALALLRLQGFSVRTAYDLDRRMLAQTVARNIEVATLTDPAPPPAGTSAGSTVNGGQSWAWTRTVARTADRRIVQVSVLVQGAPGTSPAVLNFVAVAS